MSRALARVVLGFEDVFVCFWAHTGCWMAECLLSLIGSEDPEPRLVQSMCEWNYFESLGQKLRGR